MVIFSLRFDKNVSLDGWRAGAAAWRSPVLMAEAWFHFTVESLACGGGKCYLLIQRQASR